MAKYMFEYTEVFSRSYVVESETYEEAEEKLHRAAENMILETTSEDFDHYTIKPEHNKQALEDYYDTSDCEFI